MYLNYKDIILEEKPLIRKWNTTIANKKIEENIVTLKFWPKILHIAVCLKCSDFRSFMFWVVAVIVVHCLVFQTGIIIFFLKNYEFNKGIIKEIKKFTISKIN